MLAIVILNFNNAEDTIECLESLNNIESYDYDIFLGDNSTNIYEYEKVKKYVDDYLKGRRNIYIYRIAENRGFGSGNNFILKNIDTNKYKNILLLNNDTIISDIKIIDILNKKVNDIKEEKYILGCKLLNEDGSHQESRGYYPSIKGEIKYYLRKMKIINPDKYDYLSGAFLFFNSKLINNVGLFDERFFLYFEETDLIFRAKKVGYKIYYIDKCSIIHKGGKSTGKLNKFTVEEYYKSMNIFCTKNLNYSWKKKILYLYKNIISMFGIIVCMPFLLNKKKVSSIKNKINWCKMSIIKSHLLLKNLDGGE